MCRSEFIETIAILLFFILPIKVHMLFRFMSQAGYIYLWKLFVLVNTLVASSRIVYSDVNRFSLIL